MAPKSAAPIPLPAKTYPKALVLSLAGALTGAIFGTGFGALASIFEGGPDALTGIRESWWWFASFGCVAGLFIGLEDR